MPVQEPIKPSLRADLIVTQREVEGETTYTVRDDVTGESFRMYAVEYAIAQRLNGQRDLPGIITAVQEDLHVPVTPEQLLRFLRELDSRGLLEGFKEPDTEPPPAAPASAPGDQVPLGEAQAHLLQTATLNIKAPQLSPLPTPLDDAETVASPGDAVAAGAFALVTQELQLQERGTVALAKAGLAAEVPVDPQEVQTLLRDAIHRMVGDDVRGAATILNAAHALAPNDARVTAFAEATQTAYAQNTPEAAQTLKAHGASLFPELMPQEPLGATTRPDPLGAKMHGGAHKGRWGRRLGVAALLLTIVTGGVWWRLGHGRPVTVQTRTVTFAAHEQRVSPAHTLRGEPLGTLSFASTGVVAQLPEPGARVSAHEVIASLKLPSAVRQHLLIAGQQMRQAEMLIMRLQRQREQLVGERRAILAKASTNKRRGLDARMKNRLRLLDRQERQVRAAMLAAQNRRAQVDQAQKARAQSVRGLQLFAPRDAMVDAVMTAVGQELQARAEVLRLADPQRLTLTFLTAANSQPPAVGAQVQVVTGKNGRHVLAGTVVPHDAPQDAKAEHGPEVAVALTGPDLPLSLNAYTLIAARDDKALHVPHEAMASAAQDAASTGPGAASIWLLREGKLKRLAVTVLDGDPEGLWVVPKEPQSGADVPVVIAIKGDSKGRAWASLQEGAPAQGL